MLVDASAMPLNIIIMETIFRYDLYSQELPPVSPCEWQDVRFELTK
jgi:hypothetical protein